MGGTWLPQLHPLIFWLQFWTVGGRGDASSIFSYGLGCEMISLKVKCVQPPVYYLGAPQVQQVFVTNTIQSGTNGFTKITSHRKPEL